MAIRLDGVDDTRLHSAGGLSGLEERSAQTIAVVINRNGTGTWDSIFTATDSGGATRGAALTFNTSNQLAHWNGQGGSPNAISSALTDTTNWYMLAFTMGASAATPRYHRRQEGGAWTHEAASGTPTTGSPFPTVGASGVLRIGTYEAGGDPITADIVCVGVILSELSDASVETLDWSIASWDAVFTGASAWLIDYEAITPARTDRTGNGGNETSATGGTLVSDPASWSWGGAAATRPKQPLVVTEAVQRAALYCSAIKESVAGRLWLPEGAAA